MTDTTEASNEEMNDNREEMNTEPVNDVPENENGGKNNDEAVVVVEDPKEDHEHEAPVPNGEVHEPPAEADEKKEDDEPVAEADEKKDDESPVAPPPPTTTTDSEVADEATPEAPESDAQESVPEETKQAEDAAEIQTPPPDTEETAQVSTPVSSPPRPSSLSSTPERPSSLSSTPERASFEQQQQQQQPSSTFAVQDDDTWSQITKRDRPLSNANAIAVMDHAHTVLEKRISDATNHLNMEDNLKIFQQSLGRFQNSEIKLGRRLASGNFADIFIVTSFIPTDLESKPCNKKQKDEAEEIKMKWRPNELVIKVLRGNLLLNPSLYATAAADFITEGTLLASLDHPHIVALRGRSVTSVEGFATGKRDSVFIVLERLHGDLTHKVRQWRERQSQNRIIIKGIAGLRDGRAMILKERILAMAQLADALDYLHQRNIIHRDLKLSNVGVDARGRMKLLDFGLAKILPLSKEDNEMFRLTGNTGSARYMAPEVAKAEPYNLKADVYSFAILFYEVMNLDKAFQGWQARDISDRVHHKKYRPRLPLVWPTSVREIIRATWSDVPGARLSMKHVYSMLVKEMKDLQAAEHS